MRFNYKTRRILQLARRRSPAIPPCVSPFRHSLVIYGLIHLICTPNPFDASPEPSRDTLNGEPWFRTRPNEPLFILYCISVYFQQHTTSLFLIMDIRLADLSLQLYPFSNAKRRLALDFNDTGHGVHLREPLHLVVTIEDAFE